MSKRNETFNSLPVELTWFKSSHSGPQGGDCVEVAMEWHKSSHSGNQGGECVEVAQCPQAIHVRDSKDTAQPHVRVSAEGWSEFLRFTTS